MRRPVYYRGLARVAPVICASRAVPTHCIQRRSAIQSYGTHSRPSLSCVEKARVLSAVRELFRRVQTMGCLPGGKRAVA